MALVLVADDEPTVRLLMVETLALDAHKVEAVGTESEAVLLHASLSPDLMLLDASMGAGGATSILERIDRAEGVGCPVIVVTGDVSLATPHPRVVAVIQKPFSLQTLRDAVAAALAGP
ncbi:MAG: response regulator [Planctomycetota bacterium]|nr:response regulator [Planctomycetota bacterium]